MPSIIDEVPAITTQKPEAGHACAMDDAFDAFLAVLQATMPAGPVFETSATNLFDHYLAGFDDPVEKQYHNCSCCRHFLNHYGGLVVLDAQGQQKSWLFNIAVEDVPPLFRKGYEAMLATVEKHARITRIFYSGLPFLGTKQTGPWTHLWAVNPSKHISRTETPGQAMSRTAQEFDMLRRGLADFDAVTFSRAATLLLNAKRISSDKFRVHLEQLHALKVQTDATTSQKQRDNLIWAALAQRGSGFARVRSAAIGDLLDNLKNGLPDQDALNLFASAVDPLKYKQSTSAPKAGNIARAEALFAQLGLAPSLDRRYLSAEEGLKLAFWNPTGKAGAYSDAANTAAAVKPAGVFGGLAKQAAEAAPNVLGVRASMTWEKFARTVLPKANHLALVPQAEGTYGAMTTAVHADAPALFAWDKDDARNPVSWYRWNAIESLNYGLDKPAAITGVIQLPSDVNPGVMLMVEGAQESHRDVVGLGLFPELLRSDLHEVRSTIFAHSAQGKLADAPGPQAAGLVLRRGFTNAVIRATINGVAADYQIRGWE